MKTTDLLTCSCQFYSADDFCQTDFFNKRIPLVVFGIEEGNFCQVKKHVEKVYGDVNVFFDDGNQVPVANLAFVDAIYIDGCALTECKRFDFSDFLQIMRRLRAKDGCEWDRAQTHDSIRINLIEEAYELVEAIDAKNADMMREECGDVLMQAVFHTAIAEEEKEFDFYDMFTELCRKLIDRHTHIFGQNHASTPEEALLFWNEAKKKEKKYQSNADAMDRVPKNLPSLLYAQKIQKLAKKAGFDWADVSGAILKVQEELEELKLADEAHQMEEGGDLLFAVVNVLRFFHVDSEMALHEANEKFTRRFLAVENAVKASGKEMTDCTLDELDAIWNEVKKAEKN